jgi:putative ABC transport system permease protein
MTRDRFAGVRRVLRVRDVEGDIDEEIAFHLEQTVEELIAAGVPPGRAREEADRRFGNRIHYRKELTRLDRSAATRRRWEGWWQDARLAARRMVRSPGLTAAIVLTFALGIGANATMFGIIDRLLLRAPEHIVEPGSVKRLVSQYMDPVSGAPDIDVVMTYPDFIDLAGMGSFSAVAGYSGMRLTVGDGEGARQMAARVVTGGFFGLLGATPAHGRFFGPEEDRVDGEPVAVISRGLWRDQYGDDPAVIGRTLDFGSGPFTIVGVAPQDFTGVDLDRVDVWLPMHVALSRILPPGTWELRTRAGTSTGSTWWAASRRGCAPRPWRRRPRRSSATAVRTRDRTIRHARHRYWPRR